MNELTSKNNETKTSTDNKLVGLIALLGAACAQMLKKITMSISRYRARRLMYKNGHDTFNLTKQLIGEENLNKLLSNGIWVVNEVSIQEYTRYYYGT